MPAEIAGGPAEFVARLLAATNAHQLDALAACFAEDYANETPAHPSRGFRGRAQVRLNWEQIFASVPDLTALVVRQALDDQTAWVEWEMHGTRLDGAPHAMRGVTVFGVVDGEAAWARFYLEPVDDDDRTVDEAIRRTLGV